MNQHPQVNENTFRWTIFGICSAIFLMLTVATYLIVRIADGKWASWQLPVILTIVFLVIEASAAILFALKDIKHEIDNQLNKNKK